MPATSTAVFLSPKPSWKTRNNTTCSGSDGGFRDDWGLEQVWKGDQRFSDLDSGKGAKNTCHMGNSMSKNLEGEIEGAHL